MWPFTKKFPKKDFSTLEHVPQIGDIILFRNNAPNFIADGIEWFENGSVSHVALYVGGGDAAVIEYTVGGCLRTPLSHFYADNMTIIVRRIPGLTVEDAEKIKARAYADYEAKKPYDYLSYIGFIYMQFRRKIGWRVKPNKDNPIQGSGKVCSTGVDEWVEIYKDFFPALGDEAVTPHDWEICPELKTVIEV
jgi:hypothetical protein